MQSALFVAYGTRGDVEPLLLLARAIRSVDRVIRFATHSSHSSSFEWAGIDEIILVHTDPLRTTEDVCAEYAPIVSSCEHSKPRVLVFNLFAVGTWHIAQRFQVASIAVSPCLIPYGHPSCFPSRLDKLEPGLHQALAMAADGHVGWAEVSHWMWTLWSSRWVVLRRQLGLSPTLLSTHDELPPPPQLLYALSPLLMPPPGHFPSSARVLGFFFDPSFIPRRPATPAKSATEAHMRDAPRQRIDLDTCMRHSEGRSDRLQEYLQAMLQMGPLYVGFGSSSELTLGSDKRSADHSVAAKVLRSALVAAQAHGCPLILHACGCKPLYATWARLLRLENQGSGVRFSFCTRARTDGPYNFTLQELCCSGSGSALEATTPAVSTDCEVSRLVGVLIEGSLPLHSIFPQCIAALHHGGAGTCATALLAATPQVIMPMWWCLGRTWLCHHVFFVVQIVAWLGRDALWSSAHIHSSSQSSSSFLILSRPRSSYR